MSFCGSVTPLLQIKNAQVQLSTTFYSSFQMVLMSVHKCAASAEELHIVVFEGK